MKFHLIPVLSLFALVATAGVRFPCVRGWTSCSADREQCVPVTGCPAVLAAIRKRRGNPRVCGWSEEEVPMVCCPAEKTTTTEAPTTPRLKPISRIGPEVCGKRQTSPFPGDEPAPFPVFVNLPALPVQGAPVPAPEYLPPQIQAAPPPPVSPFPIYGKVPPLPIFSPVQVAPSPVVAQTPPPGVEAPPSSGMEPLPLLGAEGLVLREPVLDEVLDEGIEPRAQEPTSSSRFAPSDGEDSGGFKIMAVGGDAADKVWPWMVAIFYGNSTKQLCGGTLIDDRHIVTAAHCFVGKSLDPSRYRVQVGILKLDEGNVDFYVQDIRLHEQYRSRYYYDDIAIMRLPFSLSSDWVPACLPPGKESVRAGDNVTVLGWGDLSYGGVSSMNLQEVNGLPVVSNTRCNEQFQNIPGKPFPRGITSTFICAGLEEGGRDACQGDSGGPLLHEHEKGYWTLVGVVSFGYKCAEPGFSGVYTKVSSYLPWIENYIRNQNEVDEERREKRSQSFEYLDEKPLWKSSPREEVMFPS